MDCIFCKIINKEIPSLTIYEDEKVVVILDIHPSTNGDCLIIPKNHIVNIFDIDSDLQQHLLKVEKYIYSILKEKIGCEGMTIVQNNEYGQDVKHLHIHMTPRYSNDSLVHSFNSEQLISIDLVHDQILN